MRERDGKPREIEPAEANSNPKTRGPISDAIIIAVARLVDDSQAGKYREPTHSDIEFQIERVGLSAAGPKRQGQAVGKAKRERAVLSWAAWSRVIGFSFGHPENASRDGFVAAYKAALGDILDTDWADNVRRARRAGEYCLCR